MLPIRKAIIPVAGYGTRFLPVTKAMPKEMLPVVDKPVIQYLVEEAVASGITDIIFVTGRGKRAIEDHFDTSYELEQTLVEREKHSLLDLVKDLPKLARFTYVRQPEPLGSGDAILRAGHLIADNEPFAVLYGDDLVDARVPALEQLIKIFDRYAAPVLALSRVPHGELSRYGAIDGRMVTKGVWKVERIVEKPKTSDEKRPPLAVIGRYILTPDILQALRSLYRKRNAGRKARKENGRAIQELVLTDALAIYMEEQAVYGAEINGRWFDCGDKGGYLKANIVYARKRPDLRRALDPFLQQELSRKPK